MPSKPQVSQVTHKSLPRDFTQQKEKEVTCRAQSWGGGGGTNKVEESLQNKSYNLSLRAALCSTLYLHNLWGQWELHEFTCLKEVGSLGNRFTLEQVQGESQEHPHRCIMKDGWSMDGKHFFIVFLSHSKSH